MTVSLLNRKSEDTSAVMNIVNIIRESGHHVEKMSAFNLSNCNRFETLYLLCLGDNFRNRGCTRENDNPMVHPKTSIYHTLRIRNPCWISKRETDSEHNHWNLGTETGSTLTRF